MIVVNDLHRPTLITSQEVQKVMGKTFNIDLARIRTNIIVAEERFIRDVLGFDFYEALLEKKNVEVTADNKATLQAKVTEQWASEEVEAVQLKEGDIVNDESFLTVPQKKMWRNHLWQIVAECVMFVAYPDNYTDFTSQGVVHNTPKFDPIAQGGANTPELGTIKFSLDKMMSGRIGPLMESLHKYLCTNKADFPLYTKKCDCDVNGKSYTGSVATFIDIYNDEEEEECC